MSDGIIIALIGVVSAILGALITGLTTIVAASMKGKSEGKSENQSSVSCAVIGLVASLGGVGGLVLGALFGVFLFQKVASNPNVSPTETVSQYQAPTTEPNVFVPPIATLTTQSTIPVPHPTFPSPSLCPDYVSRNIAQTWNIGEANVPIVDTKVAEFNTYRTYPRGNFIEGDKIPAGVIVATSFDGAGRSWNEFPVQPLVHRGNYGLFETLGEYIAPYEGACISIAP
jgi:hypothetical protein